MAEKILNTRIQLKYDSYANWTKLDVEGKYGNLVLKKGEIGICEIPSGNANATTAPTVLFKVGDGTLPFHHEDPTKCLKWASALAADVHAWAKAATKPEYQASEIKDLDKYIAGEIQDTNTDTQYSFEINADGKLEVKKTLYTLGVAGTPETVGTYDFVTPDELTTILANYYTKTEVDNLIQGVNNKIDGLDESITTVAKGTGINVTDAGTGNDHAYTVELDVNGAKTALGLDAEGIAAYVTVDSLNATAKGYADAVEAKLPTSADYGVLSVAKGDDTITIGGTAQNPTIKVTENKFDAYGAASTAENAAKKYTDDKFTEANLEQYTTEQEVKDIVDGVIKTATSKETLDSLVELVEYIDTHSGDAINMATAISALEGKVEVIEQKPAYDITATQISNWDGEVGAKALAEAALPKAIAEADYLKKADAANTYATKSEATYTAGDNIDITNNIVSLKNELVGVNSIKNSVGIAEISIGDDGRVSVNDAYSFNVYADSAYFNCGVQVEGQVKATEVETGDLTVTGDVTVGGKALSEVIKTTLVDEAGKATNDGNGDNIAGTYAKKAELHAIATSGNVNDLVQTEGDVLVFNCGTASTVI